MYTVWCQCERNKATGCNHQSGLCNQKVSSTTKQLIRIIGEVCDNCYSKHPESEKVNS